MDYQDAKEFASDAIRYFFHCGADDDNVFNNNNIYRKRYTPSYDVANKLHYETGVICFEHDYAPRLDCYNALIKYFKNFDLTPN